jgi:hypothetical protein
VDRAGALLLGELHGIAQNASVIYELMTALGIRRLALEWEPELRPVIDRFLATGTNRPRAPRRRECGAGELA